MEQKTHATLFTKRGGKSISTASSRKTARKRKEIFESIKATMQRVESNMNPDDNIMDMIDGIRVEEVGKRRKLKERMREISKGIEKYKRMLQYDGLLIVELSTVDLRPIYF